MHFRSIIFFSYKLNIIVITNFNGFVEVVKFGESDKTS